MWMERYTVFITERLNIVGMSVLPRLVCRFNKKSIKNPIWFPCSYRQNYSKIIWRGKETRIAKTNLKKKKVGTITLPVLTTYYKTTIIKAVWCWWMERHRDQWNKTESRKGHFIYIYLYTRVCMHTHTYYGGKNNHSLKSPCTNLWILWTWYLTWQNRLADMIKVKNMNWDEHPRSSGWAECNLKCLYKRDVGVSKSREKIWL